MLNPRVAVDPCRTLRAEQKKVVMQGRAKTIPRSGKSSKGAQQSMRLMAHSSPAWAERSGHREPAGPEGL